MADMSKYDPAKVAIAVERGWDRDAHQAALEANDEDQIGLTHPYNWLTEDEVEADVITYWYVLVWGDVEPTIVGPFDTSDERDHAARRARQVEGDEHGIYALDVINGVPDIEAYSAAFMEPEEP
jgi:hypothetical protein